MLKYNSMKTECSASVTNIVTIFWIYKINTTTILLIKIKYAVMRFYMRYILHSLYKNNHIVLSVHSGFLLVLSSISSYFYQLCTWLQCDVYVDFNY